MTTATKETNPVVVNGTSARVETVTPDMARKLLEGQLRNRSVSWRIVDRYAADMKAGLWKLNGQPIVLDADGHLLDGQHRLQACMQAEVPFVTLVARGIEASAFDTLDTGLKRSVIHVLGIRGELNAAVLGAGLRVLISIESGWQMSGNSSRTSLIIDALERNPKIRDSVRFIESIKTDLAPVMVISPAVALHYLGWQKHTREAADEFWRATASGANLPAYDPRFALRRRMLGQFNASRRNDNLRMMTTAYATKAWNAWISNDEMERIQFDPSREAMPEML